jgi:integrase
MPSRRSNREGTVSSYSTAAGERRWRIAYWVPAQGGRPERRVWKKGYADEDAAKKALRAVLVDLERGDHLEPTRDTLNGYSAVYLDTIRVRASTMAGYRKHYRVHIAPSRLGAMKLADITKDDLNRFYRELERSGRKDAGHEGEGLAPSTVRHIHVLISQIMAAALEDGLIRANPAKKATPPTKLEAAPPEMSTWSAAEASAFLEWSKARGDYLWLAWYLLLSTGMRRGELLALRWRDLDVDNGVLHLGRALSYVKEAGTPPVMSFTKPKSGRGRNVDLDRTGVEGLLERRRTLAGTVPELAAADALIFCNRFANPHNPVQFSFQWRKRVREAQVDLPTLPTLSVHELRHTHATLLLRAGVHPKIVSERLGHASVTITMETYSHAIASLQRDAADVMGGMLSGGTVPRTVPDNRATLSIGTAAGN